MCSPTLALMAVGTVLSAAGQMQQASAQAAAVKAQARDNQTIANYNADVAENNAIINNRAAKDASQRGADEAGEHRDLVKRLTSTETAKGGSSGLLTGKGTSADVEKASIEFGEMDALTISNNAEREAYGYKIGAMSDTAQARNLRLQGNLGVASAAASAKNIKSAGRVGALTTLVSGAADMGSAGGFGGPDTSKVTINGKPDTIVWNKKRY